MAVIIASRVRWERRWWYNYNCVMNMIVRSNVIHIIYHSHWSFPVQGYVISLPSISADAFSLMLCILSTIYPSETFSVSCYVICLSYFMVMHFHLCYVISLPSVHGDALSLIPSNL